MIKYRVSWSTDIDAETPEAAAVSAWEMMRHPDEGAFDCDLFEVLSDDMEEPQFVEVSHDGKAGEPSLQLGGWE